MILIYINAVTPQLILRDVIRNLAKYTNTYVDYFSIAFAIWLIYLSAHNISVRHLMSLLLGLPMVMGFG